MSLLTQIHFDKITEALTVNLPAFLLSKSYTPDPVRVFRIPRNSFPAVESQTSKLKPPENKKPGVERRAQPLTQVVLREARQILARGTRKVPHYRID